MVANMNNSSINAIPSSSNTADDLNTDKPVVLQVLFSVISLLAFGGNGLFCAVILRHHRLLRSPYHILIFSLAVTDMLTGVFIVATPGYIIGLSSFPAPHGLGGELFCRLISTQYFVFVFGKVSVLTIVALALERWYSVVRPIKYKLTFTKKRIYIYILIIWLLSAITNGSKPVKAQLDESSLRCIWSDISYPKQILIPSYTTLTFFIPTTITWLSFLHIARVLKTALAEQNVRFRNTRRKLSRMCALVAFLLTICWLPNQIFYTLSAFEITKAETPLHHFTIVLAMFNSCVNPWICCFTNGDYKMGLRRMLYPGCMHQHSRQNKISFGTVMTDLKHTDGVLYGLKFRYFNSGFACENEGQCSTLSFVDLRGDRELTEVTGVLDSNFKEK